MDLWNFETKDGRSIRRALDFLLPYAMGEKQWPYKQIDGFHPEELAEPLLQAASAYKDSKYQADAEKLAGGSQRVGLVLLEASTKTE